MTVDLEDYYCDLDFSEWESYPSRVVETTSILLDLFRKYNVSATFFTLGYIAEKFPELIEKITKEGHEIASHSYAHLDIRKFTKAQFESDLVKSISAIERVSGEKILGFRAPFFSIEPKTFWAFEIIKSHLRYDSSIFPVRTPLYGVPNAPSYIYRPSNLNPLLNDNSENFLELPPAVSHIPIIGNIPIAGGFHLRFLPYSFVKFGINRINKNGQPAICYIHPKDLDQGMPKIRQYNWYYYYGLKHAVKKYENLLRDFQFGSVRDVIEL